MGGSQVAPEKLGLELEPERRLRAEVSRLEFPNSSEHHTSENFLQRRVICKAGGEKQGDQRNCLEAGLQRSRGLAVTMPSNENELTPPSSSSCIIFWQLANNFMGRITATDWYGVWFFMVLNLIYYYNNQILFINFVFLKYLTMI
ncbi:hypothetical protein XENOCAPTIV_000038 [Xenoophorus captivus]|uniref:Uncharacterized protein n=1 Tax=Xenoophorus captivus TaxID=1517983 RepID=A0ABV0QXH7_9TELE